MQPAGSPFEASSLESEHAIVARWRAGDEAAFAALMERWELPVKALIARIVLSASEADDLAEEAFVRAWQQRDKFRAGAEFRPWLFAIAVNLARNRLRWWKRRPLVSLAAWEGADERDMQLKGTGGAEGSAALERAELAVAVQDAIAALPVPLREAIVLFEYEQLSHAEIAAVVGTTPKAVETRVYRAKERLRTALRGLR